jgi:hypothetical protein
MEIGKIPTTGKLIKKMCYLCTIESYSAPKQNEILSFTSKWMELKNIILSEVRHRRPKITCSPSYEDYGPETNAVILLDMGQTLKGKCTWQE